MDTVGMVMWADVQVAAWAKRRTGRALVVWDNCGPHTTEAVKHAFARNSIRALALPVKMTDILQVMDLIVNGPAKAGIRRARCENLFDYFQSWKRLKAFRDNSPLPNFTPPKPTVADGLRTMSKVVKTTLSTEPFKVGLYAHAHPRPIAPAALAPAAADVCVSMHVWQMSMHAQVLRQRGSRVGLRPIP